MLNSPEATKEATYGLIVLAAPTPSSPQRIFLTGEPGCGKTTVMKKTAELLVARGFKVGGMTSKEVRERGMRKGFCVEDFITHEEGILAEVGLADGPRVGKYLVNLQDLDAIGVRAIQRATEAADVILIDELGPMELHSDRFIGSVREALSSSKHVLATIHKRTKHPFVTAVKSNPAFTIFEVTTDNREELPVHIVEKIHDGV